MKRVTVINIDRPETSPVVARYCNSFFSRLQGFTFRKNIHTDEALVLVQNRDSRLDASIHMLGVFCDLGVVWINHENRVVDVVLARSWRPYYAPKDPAQYVLEVNPNRLSEYRPGDKVRFEEVRLD